MWTPRIRPARPSAPFSAITFTMPVVSPTIIARPFGAYRCFDADHVEARLLGRLLGVAGEGHLGMAVDAPGHVVVVDRHRVLAEDVLDDDDGLGERDVGQRRGGDAVTDGVDGVLAGTAALVDLDEAPIVDLHAGAVEPEVVGGGSPADRHDDHVDVDALAVTERHGGRRSRSARGPYTFTPVRTLILRFLNECSTTLVMSLSSPARILGSASSTVTSVPRSAIIEANSQPMAPPPITAAGAGSSRHREHLVGGHHQLAVDVEAREGARAPSPAAMTTASPVSSTSPASPPSTVTCDRRGAVRCRRAP